MPRTGTPVSILGASAELTSTKDACSSTGVPVDILPVENVSSSDIEAVLLIGVPASKLLTVNICLPVFTALATVGAPVVMNNAPRVSSSDIEVEGIDGDAVVIPTALRSYSSVPIPPKVATEKGLVPNIYCS